MARLAARRPRTPAPRPSRLPRPESSGLLDDAGGLHVAGIGSHEGTRRRAALRRPLVRARRRRASRAGRAPTAWASRRCCGCWPASIAPIAARSPPARASASAGCPRRRRIRARPSASCSAPGWASCGPCAASCARCWRGWPRATRRPPPWSATGTRRSASRRSAAGPWRRRSTRRAARWPSTTSTRTRRWRGCRAESRRVHCSRARCWRRPRCCSSTSRPTTSTATACSGSRTGCAASPGRSSSSRTTARSSTRSSAASSSSSPVVC